MHIAVLVMLAAAPQYALQDLGQIRPPDSTQAAAINSTTARRSGP